MKKKKETSNKKKREENKDLTKQQNSFRTFITIYFVAQHSFILGPPLTHWLKMASNFRYGSINNSQYMNNYSAKKK